jgi:hypothetical protein
LYTLFNDASVQEGLTLSEPIIATQSIKAALREFLIIVAGVLCALAAQAWWQGRQDRSRELEYLRQLLTDTEDNQTRLAEAIRVDSIAGESVSQLADALFGSRPLPPAATLTSWLSERSFVNSSDFQPLTGTYAALISGGDLSLIRTDSLRALLVGYSAQLANVESMLRLFLEQSVRSPDQLAVALPFLHSLLFDPESFSEPDYTSLRRSTDARSWFFALRVANRNRVVHLRRLQEATDRLHTALVQELSAEGRMPSS